jgi:hypothetical protein
VRVLLASLLCLLAAAVAAAQVAQTSRPTCELASPLPSTMEEGDTVVFKVDCSDPNGDLKGLEWSDGQTQQALDGSHSRFERGFTPEAEGVAEFVVTGIDAAGTYSAPLRWSIEVTAAGGGVSGGDVATWVGGAAALGGGAYGVRRYQKTRHARAAANVQAGINTGSMAASASGPAVGSNSGAVVQGNSGTMIHGNTGTIVMQAQTPSSMVPPGVPPRRQELYRALDEAHELLDTSEGGERVIVARDMVDEVLADLRDGKSPKAGSRAYTADAIERALESPAPRVQAGAATLRAAAAELRK